MRVVRSSALRSLEVAYAYSGVVWCFFFSSRRRHTRCSRDWSSDVCSSDLPLDVLAGGAFGLGGLVLALAEFGGADFAHGGVARALTGAPHIPTGEGAVGTPEIGRASCRERGEISVVAGSLKKKKIET